VCVVLGVNRALFTLGKQSSIELYPSPDSVAFYMYFLYVFKLKGGRKTGEGSELMNERMYEHFSPFFVILVVFYQVFFFFDGTRV
jgi:hypothetical protein